MGTERDGDEPLLNALIRRATSVTDDLAKKLDRRRAEGASPVELAVLQHALQMAVRKVEELRAKLPNRSS